MGGTKIECVVISEDQKVLYRDRVPTEASGGYNHVMGQVKKLVDMAKDATDLAPDYIGMCTPGSTDRDTGLLRNSNTVALNHKPFHADLQTTLGIPVYMENDANCLALAEHHMGIVAEQFPEASVTFGVILGTGVGGGIVHNGKLISGYNGIGGEWGHNYLDQSGGECYCGKVGCVETVISGPALERFYTSLSGERKKLKDVYTSYKNGDDDNATKTIDRLIHYFGVGISVVINIVDPDVIVIGGGVGNIDDIYTRGLEAAKRYIFSPTAKCQIVKPKLGDSGGVFGAAFIDPNA